MVICCSWLSNCVFSCCVGFDDMLTLSWALPHQISESSWFCWKTSAKTAWPFLSINPGGHNPLGLPSSLHPLGQLGGPTCPGTCTSLSWCLCHQPECVPFPWCPSLCCSLGLGDWDRFSNLEWDGIKGVVFEPCPHWVPQFWLTFCIMKTTASHTSLPLTHLPRQLWKLTYCLWSTHVL